MSLEDDYAQVETEFSWVGRSGQRARIWQGLMELIRERSLGEKITPGRYRLRLLHTKSLLDELGSVLARRGNGDEIWSHRLGSTLSPDRMELAISSMLGSSRASHPDDLIDGGRLSRATADYLARPWMQHNEIDWILLDALMYSEIAAFGDEIVSGRWFGKTNWAYHLGEGNLDRALGIRILVSLVTWMARYVLPPAAVAALFLMGYQTAAMAGAGLYAAYLVVVRLLFWPRRHRIRRRLRQEVKGATDKMVQMLVAYSLCEPPIISLGILREQISKSAEIGGIPKTGTLFSPAVFAVLDRIISRDRDVFLPLESP